jgi:uncharacterized protein (TIGR03435 family)
MKALLFVPALFAFATASVHAQRAEQTLEFEVATVRKSPPPGTDNSVTAGVKLDRAQARIGMLTLRDYIGIAYRVKTNLINGPEWMATERFDINAKFPPGATADQFPAMMQSLLASRFGLKFHREPKEVPAYALILGKPPLKLKEVVIDPNAPAPQALEASGSGGPGGIAVNMGNGGSYTFAGGKFNGKRIAGSVLADVLERYTDRPVVDATGLKGFYDFGFEVTPEEYQTLLIRAGVNSGAALPPQALRLLDNGGDPLGSAVEQLGLKLESRRMSIELFIVDQVSRTPAEN